MRFTPSAKFLRIASSSFQLRELRAYFRKTTSLSLPLSYGVWIEATSKIQALPDFVAQIEYGIGQFTADSIELIGKDILWWDEHIFNATSSENIECKIEMRIGDDPTNMAEDIIYYCSGMVDKHTVIPKELDDSYTFSVDTADVMADKMLAEFISTLYYNPIIGGAVLMNIPGVYIVSTNTGTNPVGAGIHTISYDYNEGVPQVRLNSALWLNISADGDYNLTDVTEDKPETQRMSIRVRIFELPRDAKDRSEKIIIQSSPASLPSTWYSGISLRGIMRATYSIIGIDDLTFNLPQIPTWDGEKRMSMLEYIADDQTVKGASRAISGGGSTEVYVSNANNIFRLTPSTGAFTLVCSVTTGDTVSRLMYNARLNHLWILHGTSYGMFFGGKISRYDISTDTLNSPVDVPGAHPQNIELFDFVYSSTLHEYCLLYVDVVNASITRIDGTTRAATPLFTGDYLDNLNDMPIDAGDYGFQGTAGTLHYYRFQIRTFPSPPLMFPKMFGLSFDTSTDTSWQNSGETEIGLPFVHNWGAFDSGSMQIFGYNSTTKKICRYSAAGYGPTNGIAYDVFVLEADDAIEGLYHDGTALYFTTLRNRMVHRVVGTTVETFEVTAHTAGTSFTTAGGIVYGVDNVGRLFQIGAMLELFLDVSDFDGLTIKNALSQALNACNCIGTISSSKAAMVFSRGDSTGTPITSSHAITINAGTAEDIDRNPEFAQAFDIVEIDNGEAVINYNGTDYNVRPTSLTERILKKQNNMIPTNAIKDYLKMVHQYFKISKVLYTFPVLQSLFQFEPMDCANVDFTSTKIKVSGTNCPIYNVTYSAETGKMKVGVLV